MKTIIPEGKVNQFPYTSSGDVVVKFDNGNVWAMPDMILHYVADHGWQPPVEFVSDVMFAKFEGGERYQTKGLPISVGYLTANFVPGNVPEGFIEKLEALMDLADKEGWRRQTRGG